MHTLLIHQAFVSPNEPGGTRHYELARYLVQQGHRFTIVASDLSYLTGKNIVTRKGGLSLAQEVEGIQVLRAYTYPSLHHGFIWRVVSFLSFMFTSVIAALRAGPVDLVVGTSPPIFQAVSAWCIAVIRRRPFLLEIRDLWPEFAIDMGVLKHPVLIALSRRLERFLYARATHIVVNSPAYRDYLVFKKAIKADKISLIPNGVNPDMFDPQHDGKSTRMLLGLKDKFIVTYAGALGLANDIGTVLRAAARLCHDSRIHFLFVGDGQERSNLEAQARSLGLTNVTFMGSRPKSVMPEILAASDAGVAILQNIPMFRTTYPNKVFDYMAAGRPIVLAIDGVIRQVVEAASGGVFVTPGDEECLANVVSYLSQNVQQARAMGSRARKYVVEHFHRDQQARQFAQLVQQLAKQA